MPVRYDGKAEELFHVLFECARRTLRAVQPPMLNSSLLYP
jgi:hypothetical protein